MNDKPTVDAHKTDTANAIGGFVAGFSSALALSLVLYFIGLFVGAGVLPLPRIYAASDHRGLLVSSLLAQTAPFALAFPIVALFVLWLQRKSHTAGDKGFRLGISLMLCVLLGFLVPCANEGQTVRERAAREGKSVPYKGIFP